MNDTIGVIGQKYEDRKSKKVGTLVSRDDETKKLSFLDENADPFTVSYAAFKSNWRKVVAVTPAEPNGEVVDEPVVEADTSNQFEGEPETTPEALDEEAKIKDFVKAVTDARVAAVEITPTDANVMVDDITVCTMHKVKNGYEMFMLPDIFIFANWNDSFKAGDVHFNIKHGRYSGVAIDCVKASIGDILQFIKTAAVEINLYGYID
jgi:hypothetical protein